MRTTATSPDAPRRSDAGEFVLRSGVFLRCWLRPAPWSADDLGLVATFPFVAGVAVRLVPILEGSP